MVEIYGPESSGKTTVALHAVANAQAAGGIAAFIDAEHALDPDYAKALGVDTDALLVSQPDTGEQALEIADMLIRSGALDIIVIDSVAALVPRAEIEGEMGDSHVGLQARLMSQALRKITGALSNSGTTAIFINQLREKIGVMFGCFSYGTRVTLADGTQEKIGKIVNQRMAVEVLSYDPSSARSCPKRVVNWFDNGPTEQFLQFTVATVGGNGRAQFGADRQPPRPYAGRLARGRRARRRRPGDAGRARTGSATSSGRSCSAGSMGDGNLSPEPSRTAARRAVPDGPRREAGRVPRLEGVAARQHRRSPARVNAKGAVFVDLTPLPELAELRRGRLPRDGKKHLTWDYLKALTPLALAIWYMDDGGFTVRSKGLQERTRGRQRPDRDLCRGDEPGIA